MALLRNCSGRDAAQPHQLRESGHIVGQVRQADTAGDPFEADIRKLEASHTCLYMTEDVFNKTPDSGFLTVVSLLLLGQWAVAGAFLVNLVFDLPIF